MPFSFLNPWLWFGVLAVGVPIWLHLRRKKQTNLLRFSTVRFLEDQPEPKRSPLRPRDLLLLALRALAVLLIVAAFTWPFLHRLNTVPIEESRVYILDNTLSHQANDGFARDRDRLLSELGRAASGCADGRDRIDAPAHASSPASPTIVNPPSRQSARLQPSFERGSYLAAFRQANSLLANSLGRQKRIVFLGDNQDNQWNEGVNTPPFLRQVKWTCPKTAEPLLPNISLADATGSTDLSGRPFIGELHGEAESYRARQQRQSRAPCQ